MKQYLNDVQMEVLYTFAHDMTVVAGRGIGKGVIQAGWHLKMMQRMPGCILANVGANCKRVLTNTLPSMLIHWENWGYKRNVHWVLGIKPPTALGWPSPIFTPDNWENVLSLYNGSIIYIVSQDRTGTSNSHSYDGVSIDEAKYINFQQLKDETYPANRGNKQHFGQHSFHHAKLITCDMPVTKKGSWFLDEQKKCDPDLIELIQGAVNESWRLKHRIMTMQSMGQPIPSYLRDHLKKLYIDLERMRSVAVFYKEYSSIYNMQVLGESYINQMKRDLPPLTFQTSILCKKIGIARDGFYSALRDSHKYSATDFSYLDSLEYRFDKLQDECSLQDSDIDRDRPICVAMDYNGNINWMVVGQTNGRRLNTLKSFWVKYERKIPELVDDVCKYYRHQRKKEIVFYYDSTALGSNYAVNDEDFKWVVEHEFEKQGWTVTCVYVGNPMPHMEKFLLINRMLAGQARLIPMINEQNNEDLIISIQTAGVYNGHKDKRGEKLAETEEDKLENRTDGSDAWDTLCIGCEKFPQVETGLWVTSSL